MPSSSIAIAAPSPDSESSRALHLPEETRGLFPRTPRAVLEDRGATVASFSSRAGAPARPPRNQRTRRTRLHTRQANQNSPVDAGRYEPENSRSRFLITGRGQRDCRLPRLQEQSPVTARLRIIPSQPLTPLNSNEISTSTARRMEEWMPSAATTRSNFSFDNSPDVDSATSTQSSRCVSASEPSLSALLVPYETALSARAATASLAVSVVHVERAPR